MTIERTRKTDLGKEHGKLLALVPGLPRSVRVFIMRMWKTFAASSGKAWDDSSRESRRTVVGQYLTRAPWSRCHAVISRYQAFLTRHFWQRVEEKSKTMGCWVR